MDDNEKIRKEYLWFIYIDHRKLIQHQDMDLLKSTAQDAKHYSKLQVYVVTQVSRIVVVHNRALVADHSQVSHKVEAAHIQAQVADHNQVSQKAEAAHIQAQVANHNQVSHKAEAIHIQAQVVDQIQALVVAFQDILPFVVTLLDITAKD